MASSRIFLFMSASIADHRRANIRTIVVFWALAELLANLLICLALCAFRGLIALFDVETIRWLRLVKGCGIVPVCTHWSVVVKVTSSYDIVVTVILIVLFEVQNLNCSIKINTSFILILSLQIVMLDASRCFLLSYSTFVAGVADRELCIILFSD